MQEDPTRSTGRFWGSILVFLSLAGVVAALTVLFLSMRAVMEIGGFCAEGGPYQIAQHCPQGVPILMIGSIWGGLILVGIYVWQCARNDVPSLAGLLWPALFLSLGWNFLEFGIDPPGSDGLAWGWLICAGLFILMGVVPLFVALPEIRRSVKGESGSRSGARDLVPRVRPARPSIWTPPGPSAGTVGSEPWRASATPAATTGSEPWRPGSEAPSGATGAGPSDDLVSALERLDYLHRTGGIDDEEYEAAKQRVIEGGRS